MKERGGVGKASVKAPSVKTHRLRHFEPEQQHHQKSDRNDELSLQCFSDRKKRGCGVNVSAAGHGGKKGDCREKRVWKAKGNINNRKKQIVGSGSTEHLGR